MATKMEKEGINRRKAVRSVDRILFACNPVTREKYSQIVGDYKNGIPLYICRQPKIDIEKWWMDYEEHIFD